MELVIIKTEHCDYYFKPYGDGTGTLSGGRIKGEDGVYGFFESEPTVGERPIFITIKSCTLVYGDEEREVQALGGIMLSNIVNIEERVIHLDIERQ